MSKLLKFLPTLVSSPELMVKYSSTPITEISGSVFSDSNFTSAVEVALNESEVCDSGKLYFSLKATASG